MPANDPGGPAPKVGPLAQRVAAAADLVTVALDELLPRADGPESQLTEAMRYAALGPGKRLRNALAVLQIAIALVLLIGAALMIRSFVALGRVDPGFKTEDLLAFKVSPPETKYASIPKKEAFFDEALCHQPAKPAGGSGDKDCSGHLAIHRSNHEMPDQALARPISLAAFTSFKRPVFTS